MWGATLLLYLQLRQRDISIHAPRVGSDIWTPAVASFSIYFNPRSPCGERRNGNAGCCGGDVFQSTLPVWGATPVRKEIKRAGFISIHAPRVGSDAFQSLTLSIRLYFNPRSPCGERLPVGGNLAQQPIFQSTLPVWGATKQASHLSSWVLFQSTLPVWGATSDMPHDHRVALFQSTLPVWGATNNLSHAP